MKIQIKRSNRKTVSIQVRDGLVVVSAPHHTSEAFIKSFVEEKKPWIKKHLDRYEPPGYQINQPLRLFGNVYDTEVIEGKRFSMSLSTAVIQITKLKRMSAETLSSKVDSFFKDELDRYLKSRVRYYAELLGLAVPEYSIRKFKRIHGRCMRRGDLAFNTYLYHEDYEFIDYVILHECAHLIEFNHSAAFYAIIEHHMPDYKERIAQKKNRTSPA